MPTPNEALPSRVLSSFRKLLMHGLSVALVTQTKSCVTIFSVPAMANIFSELSCVKSSLELEGFVSWDCVQTWLLRMGKTNHFVNFFQSPILDFGKEEVYPEAAGDHRS